MSMPLPSERGYSFPTPRTSLIGREREAQRVADLLLAAHVPLVTVTGPGGVGKTRLVLKVAEDLANSFRDGVWFVSLSPIHDPDLVMATIAQALGLRDGGSAPVEQRLEARLRGAETLVILDNFEQVREAAPQLAALLHACSGLKLLVTSRVILHISGEHVYPISGLPLPSDGLGVNLGTLSQNDAVRLFVSRAQASDPNFNLTDRNVHAVAGICQQLDGLPLGIELAAARIRTLSPQALHARLSRRLTVLSSRFHDLPLRHRTIRNTVDWSAQLLTPAERYVFCRLSVFAGDFSMAAAEAVVAASAAGSDLVFASDMLDILASLVDQSLLQRVSTTEEESRYRMLQVVREYAMEQLEEAGEADSVLRRHAEYFVAIAEAAAPHLIGSEQVPWLNELERMLPDLRAAMEWLAKRDEALLRLRLAIGLWRFGYTRGYLSEARQWLRFALEASPELTLLRATALNAEGLLASMQGDTELAVVCHEEAMNVSRELGNERGVAVALNGLGDAAAADGDRALAQARYESALELFRRVGERRGVAGALTNLGNLYWDGRDLGRAVELHEEALVHYQAIGDVRGIAWSASNLGTLAVELGHFETGARYLREAMAKYTLLGDPSGVVETLEGFAKIAEARGEPEREATLYAAASVIRDRIGMPVLGNFRPRYDETIGQARRALGASFDSVWAVGKAMTTEEAIELAVGFCTVTAGPNGGTGTKAPGNTYGLTRREIEILQLIALGRTNKEISDELCISHRTVSTHVSNVLAKLELTNRSALASFAHREGLV